MFKLGLNPYGLTCTFGIQGNNPHPKSLSDFVGIAEHMNGGAIEFHLDHVRNLSQSDLADLRARLQNAGIEPVLSVPPPLEQFARAFETASALGVRTLRTNLTPVLCGDRAAFGPEWEPLVSRIRNQLPSVGAQLQERSLTLAIENHQDFGSEELVEFCEIGGSSVGVTLDTGNPLAVGEEPIAFARRVAPYVRHVHLKDYRVQPTAEGFRLVRCAIGDGAIPLQSIREVLEPHRANLAASLEPGALDARHVRMKTRAWWVGYRVRGEAEVAACLAATTRNAIPSDSDWRTPWERGGDIESVCRFEWDQMKKSIENMRLLGWLPK